VFELRGGASGGSTERFDHASVRSGPRRARHTRSRMDQVEGEVVSILICTTKGSNSGVGCALRSNLGRLRLFEPVGVLELIRVFVLMSSQRVK